MARVVGTGAGFCTLYPMHDEAAQGETGEIPAIFVRPSHWRRGMGRLLCEQTLAKARVRRFKKVVLWVLEPNKRARRFYSSRSPPEDPCLTSPLQKRRAFFVWRRGATASE